MKAPNISAWRRHTAGDLTSTLHPKRSDPTVPKLPSTSKDQDGQRHGVGVHAGLDHRSGARLRHAGVPRAGGAVDAEAGDGLSGAAGLGVGDGPGTIVVLNGTPRSGKSTLARAMQQSSGRDLDQPGRRRLRRRDPRRRCGPASACVRGVSDPTWRTPWWRCSTRSTRRSWPCSRSGLNVVVDVGHHDDYSKPLGILAKVAGELRTLPAYFVGVRCPVEVIMARRDAGASRRRLRQERSRRNGARGRLPVGAGGTRSGHLRPGGGHVEGVARGLRRSRCAPARRGATGGLRRAGGAPRLSSLPHYHCSTADGLPEPGPAGNPALEWEVHHGHVQEATPQRRAADA